MSDFTYINADRAAELQEQVEDLANELELRGDELNTAKKLELAKKWWTLADRMRYVVDKLDDLSTDIAMQNNEEAQNV